MLAIFLIALFVVLFIAGAYFMVNSTIQMQGYMPTEMYESGRYRFYAHYYIFDRGVPKKIKNEFLLSAFVFEIDVIVLCALFFYYGNVAGSLITLLIALISTRQVYKYYRLYTGTK